MSAWKKSTTWRRTMKGFPAGWITITRGDGSSHYAWQVVLVDVPDVAAEGLNYVNFTSAKSEALDAYLAAGARLEKARGLS